MGGGEGFIVADVGDDDVVFCDGGYVGGCEDGFLQLRNTVAVLGADADDGDGLSLLVGNVGEWVVGGVVEVGFVHHGDEFFPLCMLQHFKCLFKSGWLVGEPQCDDGLVKFFVGALDAHTLDDVRRVAQTGGVDKAEGDAMQQRRVFYHVASGAVDVAHYRLIIVEQAVEQRAFAYVGLADDGHGNPFAQGFPFCERAREGVDAVRRLLCQREQFAAVGKFHVLVAEVQFQLQEGGEVE